MGNPKLKSFGELARAVQELHQEARENYESSANLIRDAIAFRRTRKSADYDRALVGFLLTGLSFFTVTPGRDCLSVLAPSGKIILGTRLHRVTFSQFRRIMAHMMAHAFASATPDSIQSITYQSHVCAISNHSLNGASASSWVNKFGFLSGDVLKGKGTRSESLVVMPYEIPILNASDRPVRTTNCVSNGDNRWGTISMELHKILETLRFEPGSRIPIDDPLLFQIVISHFPEVYPLQMSTAVEKLWQIVGSYESLMVRAGAADRGAVVFAFSSLGNIKLESPRQARSLVLETAMVENQKELRESLKDLMWCLIVSDDEIFLRKATNILRETAAVVHGIYVCYGGETPIHPPCIDPPGVVRLWIDS